MLHIDETIESTSGKRASCTLMFEIRFLQTTMNKCCEKRQAIHQAVKLIKEGSKPKRGDVKLVEIMKQSVARKEYTKLFIVYASAKDK